MPPLSAAWLPPQHLHEFLHQLIYRRGHIEELTYFAIRPSGQDSTLMSNGLKIMVELVNRTASLSFVNSSQVFLERQPCKKAAYLQTSIRPQ